MKYILFWVTTSNDRVRYLYANNYKNLKGKYEILYDININQLVKFIDGIIFIKDYLLNIEINRTNLFISTE